MTKEQIQGIQKEKGTTMFTVSFIMDFAKRWEEMTERLKKSGADLAKIRLAEEIKEGE